MLHIKSAVKGHNKFDLSKTHLTTLNFGQILPCYCEETVPGDKFNIDASYFSRMAPLKVPTYGKIHFKTVAGFVPYYMIAEDSDAWLDGKTSWEGQTPRFRYFTMYTLATFLHQFAISNDVYHTPTASVHDWAWTSSNGNLKYHNFTQKGKYYLKVLQSLGYTIPSLVDEQSGSDWMTNVANLKLSAYPLLAFFKLYNDYMSQSQRFNTSFLSELLTNIKFCKTSGSDFNGSTGAISLDGLNKLFNALYLNYENDYFTSAWETPNNPINNIENVNIMPVPASGADAVTYDQGNTYYFFNSVSGTGASISQRGLDFLKSFNDWVRRNNYSGSRSVQQIYSRFGIKTDDYRSHYAQVITTDDIPIQVGDVMAMSDTAGAKLGDYAGKGIMNGGKNINIQCSDHGLLLVLCYYTVTPMNSFGFDRRVLRTEPLDYYNPEFDGLGADAISVGEFYADPASYVAGAPFDNAVFGFTERYNAYRYGRDVITGEFRDGSKRNIMDSWHTGRYLTDIRNTGNLVAQSSQVNCLPQENPEYDRIFGQYGNLAGEVDKFYLTAQFRVSAVRPMLSLNQVPCLGEGDTTVPRNGNTIS